ncbi:MAG TPA: hypothetical protein VHF89_00975 [Solirubrobacteraceae bacterium]|nr:hypothetical protein [Solirubrobacteraceae bacterium]
MTRPVRKAFTLGVLAAALLAPAAAAQTPFVEIATPSGPLTRIILGNELSCQVAYSGDAAFELYPSGATPGDCGTFVATGGTLYAPDFSNHSGGNTATSGIGSNTPFTPVSQSGVSGSGSSSDPKRVTTVADAGSLRLTQVDSYINGQEAYRTDVEIRNNGGSAASGVIYRAGDCYLQESDTGYGFVDGGANAAGCSLNANNSPAARIEQWYPLTGGARYMEAGFSEVWSHIGTKAPFPNTCRCTEQIDNGAGVSWEFNIPPGGTATFSHLTVFSPRGQAGPPPPPDNNPPSNQPSGPLPPAFGPGGVVSAPSNRVCRSRRNFKIRLRNPPGTTIVAAVVRVNGRRVRTVRNVRVTARVDLRGLPRGRYTVSITILLDDGRTIRGKRKYRTCGKKRRRGRVPKV